MKTIDIFTPDQMSMEASCLGCAKYFTCKAPEKSGAWKCGAFESMMSANTDDLFGQMQAAIDLTSTINLQFEDNPEEVGEFESMINSALSSNRLVPLDLAVDDGDVPEAANYYDWCYGNLGIKFNPFARQLWIAAKLFGEICPHCSDPKWYHDIENVPVDFRGVDLKEHLTFLEFGVCPKCRRGRAAMFKDGDLNIYSELAICLGQRSGKCVSHDTLILSDDGIQQIGDMRPASAKRGEFTPFNANLVGPNGETLKAAKYYVNPPERLYRVTTHDGKHVDATANHQLWTTEGWVRVGDLKIGEVIPVRVGQNVWGRTIPVYGNQPLSIESCHVIGKGFSDTVGVEVPECILRAPKDYVLAFIRGCFGSNVRLCGGFRFVMELSVILGNLGFVHQIRGDTNLWVQLESSITEDPKPTTYYTTVVSVEPLGVAEAYDFEVPGEHCFMANGLLNHNSIQTGGLASYHLHKNLKTVRPAEHYGLAASTTLTHTYTGLQYKRAYALLWTPIRDTITDSPWFKEYHKLLKYHGERMGEELVVIKDTFINWRRSRMLASPAAPNIGTLRGDTRLGGGIDELGFFKFGAGAEDFVTISADEIHASLTNSLATIRTAASRMIRGGDNNVQQGIMFNLSSPSSVFDKIMTLVRASVGSRTILGVRLPTWDMNPQITREDLQIYWDTDPVKAERDFGANPPLAASPFFEDHEALSNVFTGGRNRIKYTVVEEPNTKTKVLERWARIDQTFELAKMPPSIATIDSGVSNNSFSLTISIPVARGRITSPPKQNSLGYANKPKKPVMQSRPLDLNTDQVDGGSVRGKALFTIEVIPPKNGRINFNRVLNETLVPLLKPYNVQVVVTDRWQNILLLDTLRDEHGINTFQYSLRYKDFEVIRSYIEGGMFECPATESDFEDVATFDNAAYPYCFEGRPIDHLALQFMTVQDNGRTVDKGPNLTDDSFRSIALAVHYVRDIDFVTQYLSGPDKSRSVGGGLVAAPGGEASGSVVAMSSNAARALVAAPGGAGGDGGNTFSRTKR